MGYAAGLLWEQIHRHRRRERLKRKALLEAESIRSAEVASPRAIRPVDQPPRLHLVGPSISPLPDLVGARLRSVRFFATGVELDFGTMRAGVNTSAVVSSGTQKYRYPDAGSRDALCALIGASVERLRIVSGDRVEIAYDNGCELIVSRSGLAVA
jgi:hypothetical protein